MSTRTFRFDDWTLNLSSGELERGGARTRLQEHPLQVLVSLLDNAGQEVTRELLFVWLWSCSFVVFVLGLFSSVWLLWAALGDTAETPRYIETIPRRGYRFIGTVHGEERPATPVDQALAPVGASAGPGTPNQPAATRMPALAAVEATAGPVIAPAVIAPAEIAAAASEPGSSYRRLVGSSDDASPAAPARKLAPSHAAAGGGATTNRSRFVKVGISL